MSELGEDFAAMREASVIKRAANREESAALLTAKGILYTTHNEGAHLIVTAGGKVWDFWPGTGKWVKRPATPKAYRRGVRQLIEDIKRQQGG